MAEFVMRISDLSSDVCSSDLWQYDLQSNDTFCSNLKFDLLIFDLVRGVLGYDGIDGAVLETPEKRLAVSGCTKRRTHFIVTIEADNQLVRHHQVVGRYFTGNGYAPCLGQTDQIYASGGTDGSHED